MDEEKRRILNACHRIFERATYNPGEPISDCNLFLSTLAFVQGVREEGFMTAREVAKKIKNPDWRCQVFDCIAMYSKEKEDWDEARSAAGKVKDNNDRCTSFLRIARKTKNRKDYKAALAAARKQESEETVRVIESELNELD